jgi:hypothetical protein
MDVVRNIGIPAKTGGEEMDRNLSEIEMYFYKIWSEDEG